MRKKTYVIDTSVCLNDPLSLESFKNNDIVLPIKVLEEIDKHKSRQGAVGLNARTIIRFLDELRERGCLHKGVRIAKGKGILFVSFNREDVPSGVDPNIPDNKSSPLLSLKAGLTPKRKLF